MIDGHIRVTVIHRYPPGDMGRYGPGLDMPVAQVKDDAGTIYEVTAGYCYRNGTSPGHIRVGDVGEIDPKRGGFSCPNTERWRV